MSRQRRLTVAASCLGLVVLAACSGTGAPSTDHLPYETKTLAKAKALVQAAEAQFVHDNVGFFSLQENVGETLGITGSFDLSAPGVDYTLRFVGESLAVQTVLVNGKGFVRLERDDKPTCWMRLDPRGGVAPDQGPIEPMEHAVPPWPSMPMNAEVLGLDKEDPAYVHVRLRLSDVLPSLFPTDSSGRPYAVPGDATVAGVLHVYRGTFEGLTLRVGDVVDAAKTHDVDIVGDYLGFDPKDAPDIADGKVSISYRLTGQDHGVEEPDLSGQILSGRRANCVDGRSFVASAGIPT